MRAANAGFIAAGVAAATLALRAFVLVRARRSFAALPQHAFGPGGVYAGAEPLRLVGTGERALLLLHGFNDTPQSVAQLAHAMHARGWSVSVPLLPNHGRGPVEFAEHGSAAGWLTAARAEWDAVRQTVPCAVLAGQSMGGAIAVILAGDNPPAALVLLAPYLALGWLPRALAFVWPLWAAAVPVLRSDPRRGLHDPAERAKALGNGQFTPRLVRELGTIATRAWRALSTIRCPVLVMHSRHDYRIPSRVAQRAFATLDAPDKTLMWRERAGHVLAADVGREEVYAEIGDWLDVRTRRDTPHAQPGRG